MSKREIARLKREIARLKELVNKDELTSLYNRRGFKDESGKFISQLVVSPKFKEKRKSFVIKNFSLIIFDIDNFKKLNDKYGHLVGDEALKFLARLIGERVRDIDIVCRWGGEEIVVGLIGASEKDAFNVADDIREKLERRFLKWKNKKIKFTVSGGVASFDKVKNLEELFHRADEAMYRAKKLGKNRIIKYSDLYRRVRIVV
jgi:diguanylate cyclase (GGDEF)-like protein